MRLCSYICVNSLLTQFVLINNMGGNVYLSNPKVAAYLGEVWLAVGHYLSPVVTEKRIANYFVKFVLAVG